MRLVPWLPVRGEPCGRPTRAVLVRIAALAGLRLQGGVQTGRADGQQNGHIRLHQRHSESEEITLKGRPHCGRHSSYTRYNARTSTRGELL